MVAAPARENASRNSSSPLAWVPGRSTARVPPVATAKLASALAATTVGAATAHPTGLDGDRLAGVVPHVVGPHVVRADVARGDPVAVVAAEPVAHNALPLVLD